MVWCRIVLCILRQGVYLRDLSSLYSDYSIESKLNIRLDRSILSYV